MAGSWAACSGSGAEGRGRGNPARLAYILGGGLLFLWTLIIWSHDVTDDQPSEALTPIWAAVIVGAGGLLLLRAGLRTLEVNVSDLLLVILFLAGLLLAFPVSFAAGRTTLVRQSEALQAARMRLNSAYRARAELIPNLVQVVRSFTKTKETTIQRVLDAQARLDRPASGENAAPDAAAPREVVAGVRVLMDRLLEFPQLQSAPMYRQLMANLSTTQSDITYCTGEYNTLAARFNTAVRTFPLSLIARWSGIAPVPYLDADLTDEERSSRGLLGALP